jgi:Tfp pilus assembly PilM family ATPase
LQDTTRDKTFLALAFQKERVSAVSIENGKVQAIASQELMHPFGIETLRSEEISFGKHAEAVQRLCEAVNGQGKSAGVVLGHDLVQIKRFPVALGMDNSLLKEHLEWEAKQACISDVGSYTLVANRLPAQQASGNHLYLVVLVRKWIVASVRRLIERAGIRLNDIDVDVFTHIQAVLANYPVPTYDLVLIVDIKSDDMLLTVVKQRDYFQSRRIPTRNVSDMSAEDLAELIKKEVKRLVFAHRLGNDIEVFNSIYICGENDLEGVQQVLSSSISAPVKKVNPFFRARTLDTLPSTEDFVQRPERYIAPMGLAFKRLPSLSMEMTSN